MTILLLLAGIAVLPSEALPAEAEVSSASELIKKSEAAYAAVKTYVGTTTVRTKSDHGGKPLESISKAKVTFMRPGKFLIEGTTASHDAAGNGGNPFSIVSDGKTTWKSWAIQNNGAYQEVKNLGMAGMGGVAHGAAETIPSALMKSDGAWVGGSDPFIVPRFSKATIDGHEKIDGADCYKLTAPHPELGTVTMWIDSKNFLLRQMTRDSTEAQLARASKAADEAMKKFGKQRPANANVLKSMSHLFAFEIYQVDGLVSETLFADPTKK